ncbi:KRAB-A domain-containing protein 2-like [Penaeus monodon]|uniref:KRAB-A domain-containing protein 2-like n=1 Tax=Penaeus monodon TaxID=6687 RepID=UPI0018A6EA85|nr:KRAB-A domain-containing protein 2-like [Penaeus monodon]
MVYQDHLTKFCVLRPLSSKQHISLNQGSVERANGDIKDMLVAWMGDNNTTDWSIGIKFVQFQKNSSLHAGIRRSPYVAMFQCEAKVGLTSSSLPDEVIQRMQCVDDLLNVLTPVKTERNQVLSQC